LPAVRAVALLDSLEEWAAFSAHSQALPLRSRIPPRKRVRIHAPHALGPLSLAAQYWVHCFFALRRASLKFG
jgi:hypothetical protein